MPPKRKPSQAAKKPGASKALKITRQPAQKPSFLPTAKHSNTDFQSGGDFSSANKKNPQSHDINADTSSKGGALHMVKELFNGHQYRDVTKKDFASIVAKFGQGQVQLSEGKWKVQGLKTTLMHFQVFGSGSMLWRETKFNREKQGLQGGMLCDTVGFGKTLQTLTLIVNDRLRGVKKNGSKHTTLIVASPDLAQQWWNQIKQHCEKKAAGRVTRFFENYRLDGAPDAFEDCDIILTTWGEVTRSYNANLDKAVKASRAARRKGSVRDTESRFDDSEEEWDDEDEELDALHNFEFYRIVLDEADSIKNSTTLTSIATRNLKAKFRWALTATPVRNSLSEFYPYFDFVRYPGVTNKRAFNKLFLDATGDDHKGKLQDALREVVIRRTHSNTLMGQPLIDIKDYKKETNTVRMGPEESRFSALAHESVMKYINEAIALDDVSKLTKMECLQRFSEVRQATASPLLTLRLLASTLTEESIANLIEECDNDRQLSRAGIRDLAELVKSWHVPEKSDSGTPSNSRSSGSDSNKAESKGPTNEELLSEWFEAGGINLFSAKTRAVIEQVEKWLEEYPNEKIIVFSQFVGMTAILKRSFESRNPGSFAIAYTGKLLRATRQKKLQEFRTDGDVPIIFATMGVTGVGLNLQAASRVILVDHWWNREAEMQAIGRVFRIGQKYEVNVSQLYIHNTIDQMMMRVKATKAAKIGPLMNTKGRAGEPSWLALVEIFRETMKDVLPGGAGADTSDVELDYGDDLENENDSDYVEDAPKRSKKKGQAKQAAKSKPKGKGKTHFEAEEDDDEIDGEDSEIADPQVEDEDEDLSDADDEAAILEQLDSQDVNKSNEGEDNEDVEDVENGVESDVEEDSNADVQDEIDNDTDTKSQGNAEVDEENPLTPVSAPGSPEV